MRCVDDEADNPLAGASLDTPEVRSLAERTDPAVVEEVLAKLAELDFPPPPPSEAGDRHLNEEAHARHARALPAVKEHKEARVGAGGIGADVKPVLSLMTDGRLIAGFGLPESRDRSLALVQRIVALSDAPFVHFAHEAYTEMYDENAGEAELRRLFAGYDYGSLEQRFAAGDTRVAESVTLVTAQTDHVMATYSPYRYNGRHVTWLQEIVFDECELDHEIKGDVVDALRKGFAEREDREGPALSPKRISALLEVGVTLPASPARNGPCTCGSGRKAKVCCW